MALHRPPFHPRIFKDVNALIETQVTARKGLACDGLYTVRRSDKTGDLVLSFRSAGAILHYEIRGEKTGQFQIFKSTAAGIVQGAVFGSLLELRNCYLLPLSGQLDRVMPCPLTDQVTIGTPLSHFSNPFSDLSTPLFTSMQAPRHKPHLCHACLSRRPHSDCPRIGMMKLRFHHSPMRARWLTHQRPR